MSGGRLNLFAAAIVVAEAAKKVLKNYILTPGKPRGFFVVGADKLLASNFSVSSSGEV